ncbi:GroES-like protein [Xylariaceae sp. FL0255]|nr:GroES-like protein [Xylariaceae sp. FL0255]
MKAKMRAVRYYGTRDVRLEHDIPEPKCGADEVKIRPAFVGICGTDIHEYQSQTLIPRADRPHALSKQGVPVTIGHEISGTVVEIGADVPTSSNIKVGDQVAVLPLLYCRQCVPCHAGYPNCCTRNGFIGISGHGGGLSDFLTVDHEAIFKLPDNISLEIGALVEPLAVAWHAVVESGIRPGQDCLVFGTGPIGLAVIQCLNARNAGQIIAVEVAAQRQEFARQFGATHLLDPTKVDVVKEAKALTGGLGPPVAFDCAGVEATLSAATRAVSFRGTIMNVAIWERPTNFNPNNVVFHEKKYIGSLTYVLDDYKQVIEALQDERMKPAAMITGKIAMERIVEDGLETLINERDKHVKILVDLTAN